MRRRWCFVQTWGVFRVVTQISAVERMMAKVSSFDPPLLQISDDRLGRMVSRQSGDAAAGVCARAAQVKTFHGRAIVCITGRGTKRINLVA